MKRLGQLLFLATLGVAFYAPAQDAATVREAVARACDGVVARQQHGGWPRAFAVGRDLRFGEHNPISDRWITVQPPATPAVGMVLIAAAQQLDAPRWAEAAFAARDALANLQTAEGGLPHEGNPNRNRNTVGTLDDDTTTATLDFFLAVWRYTGDDADRALARSVGDFLLTAQYESGGWPQRYPPPRDHYGRHITLNDGAMPNAIKALLRLHAATGDGRYLDGAKRGGDCLIRLQGGAGEAIWAQQYHADTLEPAWARVFEPPGYTPGESLGALDALLELYLATGEPRYLEPLPKAFAWYDTHRLDNGRYARLYEPGTGRPVYGGSRDERQKVYDVAEATGGYGWQGDYTPEAQRAAYMRIQEVGRDAYLAERVDTPAEPVDTAAVQALLDAQAPHGLWERAPRGHELTVLERRGWPLDTPIIGMGDFVAHTRTLLDWLGRQAPEAEERDDAQR